MKKGVDFNMLWISTKPISFTVASISHAKLCIVFKEKVNFHFFSSADEAEGEVASVEKCLSRGEISARPTCLV